MKQHSGLSFVSGGKGPLLLTPHNYKTRDSLGGRWYGVQTLHGYEQLAMCSTTGTTWLARHALFSSSPRNIYFVSDLLWEIRLFGNRCTPFERNIPGIISVFLSSPPSQMINDGFAPEERRGGEERRKLSCCRKSNEGWKLGNELEEYTGKN